MAENLTTEERTKENHRGRRKSKNRSEMSVEHPPANPNRHPAPDEGKQPKLNFFQRLAQMTPEEWDRHRVYVYRQWPRITRDGQPHYIDKHATSLDEETIKRLYGSGRYSLRLNTEKRTIDQTSLEIMDLACPPKVSSDELVDAPENERYHKLWPSTPTAPKPAEGANAGDAAAVKELVGLLKTLVVDRGKSETDEVKNTLINWALSQTSKEREANSPGALVELVTAIKSILPNPAPAAAPDKSSEMALAIIAQLKSIMQPAAPPDMLTLLQQAREIFQPAAAKDDDFERFDRLLSVADKLADRRGGGGGRRSGLDVGLDYVRELAPYMGGPLMAMLGRTMGLGQPPAAAPGAAPGMMPGAAAPPAPTAFDPYANPGRLREHSRTVNAQTPPPPPPPTGPGSTPAAEMPAGDLATLIQVHGGLVVTALNGNMPGSEFAGRMADFLGEGMVAMVSNYGEQTLADTLLQFAELRMFGEAKVRRFVHEFLSEEPPENQEGEEGERATQRAGA
jgi:hypothetical protein